MLNKYLSVASNRSNRFSQSLIAGPERHIFLQSFRNGINLYQNKFCFKIVLQAPHGQFEGDDNQFSFVSTQLLTLPQTLSQNQLTTKFTQDVNHSEFKNGILKPGLFFSKLFVVKEEKEEEEEEEEDGGYMGEILLPLLAATR